MRHKPLEFARAAARGGGPWTIVDQAISSLATLALSVFVARNVPSAAFGAFGLAFAAFTLFGNLNRALVNEPWLVRASRAAATGAPRCFAPALAATAGTSTFLAVISAVVGLSTTGALRAAFLSLALVLPGLLVQDLCRYFFFAARRYRGAATLDAVWTGTYLAAVVWLELRGTMTLAPFVLVWGAGAYISALSAFLWLRISPAALLWASRGLNFLRETRRHGGPLAAEYATTLGSYNIALVGVAALASTASIAALRGAQVLFGPLQVVSYAGAAFLLPRWSAREVTGSKVYRNLALQAALVLVAVTVAWTAALQAVPESVGELLLGSSWPAAKAILFVYGLFMIVNSAQSGMKYAFRAAARSDRLLLASLIQAPLTIALVALGASIGAAQGAAGGLLVSHSVGLLVTFRQLLRLTTAVPEKGARTTRAQQRTPELGGSSRQSSHMRRAAGPSQRAGPSITVAVCTRDRPDQLKKALTAVVNGLDAGQSVLVVDSASTDDRTAAVARSMDIAVVRVEEPGLSRARNAAIACVRTELIAFTDDDCLPRRGWLTPLREVFSDPRVGFVTGSVVSDLETGPRISVMDKPEPRRFSGQRITRGIGHGANMAFRIATLKEVGGFDPCLGAGTPLSSGEDSDMFLRCLMFEWEGVFEPRSTVVHEQWRTTLAAVVRLRYGHGLGAGALCAKRARVLHHSPWQQLGHVVGLRGLAPVAKSLVSRPPSHTLAQASYAFGYFRGYATGLAAPIVRDTCLFAPPRDQTLAPLPMSLRAFGRRDDLSDNRR